MPVAGLAKFDSASAMVQALARFLHGRDFPGLNQPAALRTLVHLADWVPRQLREQTFAFLGAREGVLPDRIEDLNAEAVAAWATEQYPRRRYPAVLVGSSNGALLHLAAACGIPWLPQTFLALVRQTDVHPDDAMHALKAPQDTARRFLEANPGVQLHHLHDPNQDRLMLGRITYFRFKYLRLPEAYRRFLDDLLEPGGLIIIVDCTLRWPVTQVAERYVHQFGAVGGATLQDYFHGGPRVAGYLARYGSPRRQWTPPEPTGEWAEAEWGFEPALNAELEDFARRRGGRMMRLSFADPEEPSPAVADLYRTWNEERGISERRLVIESFVLLEPYWVLRTGAIPYWMTFNMEPSLRNVERYLSSAPPLDELHLMLFAHGVNSVGLPPIDDWQRLLARARRHGSFLGINPRRYPAHFAHFAKYSGRLRRLPRHYPLPPPLPLERLESFIEGWRRR